jgi:hypothetical protein
MEKKKVYWNLLRYIDLVNFGVSIGSDLTKWPEVFLAKNRNAATFARFLKNEIIPRHGVPEKLLSDHGPEFLGEVTLPITLNQMV